MEKKMTRKENYEVLREIVEDSDIENKDELFEFINSQIEKLDKEAEKAKERAAKKRAEGDELRAVIKSILTEEYQTADDIAGQIEGEDITRAKVSARLTQLVNSGDAEKGRKDNKMAYKVAE